METGTVKWFNPRKGFGFITKSDDEEIFIHYSNIISDDDGFKTLYENDEVSFDVEQGMKGPEAKNVTVTKKAPRPQFNNNNRYGNRSKSFY